jgi:hypothetical protein
MATIRDVIFDSRHPASIARFWASAIEANLLTGLGARILAKHEDWITLADPEGNEFCIQRTAATGTT